MDDGEIRAALDRHWAASDVDDFEAEHDIYRKGCGARIPAIGRAHPRAAEHTVFPHRTAEPETLQRAADRRRGRPLDHRIRPDV